MLPWWGYLIIVLVLLWYFGALSMSVSAGSMPSDPLADYKGAVVNAKTAPVAAYVPTAPMAPTMPTAPTMPATPTAPATPNMSAEGMHVERMHGHNHPHNWSHKHPHCTHRYDCHCAKCARAYVGCGSTHPQGCQCSICASHHRGLHEYERADVSCDAHPHFAYFDHITPDY